MSSNLQLGVCEKQLSYSMFQRPKMADLFAIKEDSKGTVFEKVDDHTWYLYKSTGSKPAHDSIYYTCKK